MSIRTDFRHILNHLSRRVSLTNSSQSKMTESTQSRDLFDVNLHAQTQTCGGQKVKAKTLSKQCSCNRKKAIKLRLNW